jgi:hypothetical protein
MGIQVSKQKREKKHVKQLYHGQTKQSSTDIPYALSRYVPAIKYIVEDHITGKLSKKEFPYILEPPEEDTNLYANKSGNSEKKVEIVSLRK